MLIILQTMRFSITLVVREKVPPFQFRTVPSHDAVGINVGKDDILQSFCGRDNVAMNRGTPWRRPQEKARAFMQMVVEALSALGDVIMDYTTGTCMLWSYLICSTGLSTMEECYYVSLEP